MKLRFKHWRDDLIRPNTRTATNKALDLANEGLISWHALAEMALKWMDDNDVAEMLKANGLDEEGEDNE